MQPEFKLSNSQPLSLYLKLSVRPNRAGHLTEWPRGRVLANNYLQESWNRAVLEPFISYRQFKPRLDPRSESCRDCPACLITTQVHLRRFEAGKLAFVMQITGSSSTWHLWENLPVWSERDHVYPRYLLESNLSLFLLSKSSDGTKSCLAVAICQFSLCGFSGFMQMRKLKTNRKTNIHRLTF